MCCKSHCKFGKLETLGATGQALEGVSQVPRTILFTVNPATVFQIQGVINAQPVHFMIDTGAAVSLISLNCWHKIKTLEDKLNVQYKPGLVGVDGSSLQVAGTAQLYAYFAGQKFIVSAIVVESLQMPAILGIDFLESNKCVIDTGSKSLQIKGVKQPIPLQQPGDTPTKPSCIWAILPKTIRIPGNSEMEVMAKLGGACQGETLYVEGRSMPHQPSILVAAAVVSPGESQEIPIRLVNWAPDSVTIYKGTRVATLEEMNSDIIVSEVKPTREPTGEVSEKKLELLRATVASTSGSLTTQQQDKLLQLLLCYEDVFAVNDSNLGCTSRLQHHIDTGSAVPVRQPARRIPPYQREEVKSLLDDMEKRGIIQPSKSPWASPVVLVRKKDNTIRFCVDYRRLNELTRKDAYPLPRVDDTLETLSGSRWFSTLDLLSGYWQVEVAENDRAKTAFTTKEGLYEFKVMPFGLSNAPATFQRLMDLTLAGLQWSQCLVYLDDIIVVGRTFEEHLHNLGLVLERLQGAKLRVKPSKCALFQDQVCYLGHIVSSNGITTDPSKTSKIVKWPTPTNVQQVQQFLGLAGYYRRFIRNFAEIARPLHRLTEQGRQFSWTQDCESAFSELKSRLTTTPILAFPDFHLVFTLDTDASQSGIGAVLSQVQNGTEKVIAYASRSLTKAERRYSVTRLEMLAVVTFMRHFRHYLLGRHFVLRTDHSSLKWLRSFKEPEGQIARWLESMQEFDFEVMHRKGVLHNNADSLSRHPGVLQDKEQQHQDGLVGEETSLVMATLTAQPVLTERSPKEIRALQLTDTVLGPLMEAMEANQKPEAATTRGKDRSYTLLLQQWDQLIMQEGLLFRNYQDASGNTQWSQLVVPKALQEEVIYSLHGGVASGHLGEEKTLSRLREKFYWPGFSQQVQDWCRSCYSCAARKTPAPHGRGELQSVLPGYPLQMVAVDIMGPLPETPNHNRYVLVATDYFTRWTEAYAIPNMTAETVASKLLDEFFLRFSLPEQIHSDQGSQFESKLFQELMKILQIKKTRTTPYHPQSDGVVERFNRTLLSMLATVLEDNPWDWEDQLMKVCYAYNTSSHPGLKHSPFYLMFGRRARLPVDIAFGLPDDQPVSTSQYASSLHDKLGKAYTEVRKSMNLHLHRQKEIYDRKVHGKAYKEGDLVWLHIPVRAGVSRKFYKPWSGPFKVCKKLSDVTYRIQNVKNRRNRVVVHFDRLKRFSAREGTLQVPAEEPGSSQLSSIPVRLGQSEVPSPGSNLELCESDDDDVEPPQVPGRRYPTRSRRPPARLRNYVPHH